MGSKPPYTITIKAADYLAKIVEAVTRLEFGTDFKRDLRLHRENRLRTIHSSLAIEGNALSLGEVADVLQGRIVAGRQEDIKEVKNAYAAYDQILTLDPYSIDDFLKAHQLMTDGLLAESGRFRSGNVGVFDGNMPVHIGARPEFVPSLMEDLFGWAKESELHPVLKSAVLHFEIETIHPLADGNGRMGRLWQTLMLAQWNSLFAWIPMESVVHLKRPQYYQAIQESRKANDSAAFIEFTLSAILDSTAQQKHQVEHQVEHQVGWSSTQRSILAALVIGPLSRKELFAAIGVHGDSRAFSRHVEPLLTQALIEMTVPDKPNSRLQKYRLTIRGKEVMANRGGQV